MSNARDHDFGQNDESRFSGGRRMDRRHADRRRFSQVPRLRLILLEKIPDRP